MAFLYTPWAEETTVFCILNILLMKMIEIITIYTESFRSVTTNDNVLGLRSSILPVTGGDSVSD